MSKETASAVFLLLAGSALVLPLYLGSKQKSLLAEALSKHAKGEPLSPTERDMVQEHLGRPV